MISTLLLTSMRSLNSKKTVQELKMTMIGRQLGAMMIRKRKKKKVIIRSQVGAMMNGASLSHPIRIVPLMNQFRVLQMTVALRIS